MFMFKSSQVFESTFEYQARAASRKGHGPVMKGIGMNNRTLCNHETASVCKHHQSFGSILVCSGIFAFASPSTASAIPTPGSTNVTTGTRTGTMKDLDAFPGAGTAHVADPALRRLSNNRLCSSIQKTSRQQG